MAWRRPPVEWRPEVRLLLNRVIVIVVLANVVLLVVSHFGKDTGSSVSSSRATSTTVTVGLVVPTTRPVTQPTSTGRSQPIDGGTLTLHGFQLPANGLAPAARSRSGYSFAAADVEACAAAVVRGGSKIDRLRFLLELSDQRKLQSVSNVKQPSLTSTSVAPGSCVRGWVGFEVQQADHPAYLLYQGTTVVRWPVS